LVPVHSGLSSALATVAQVPVAHDWQALVHAALQQTPSLQKPVAQSAAAAQVWPFFFLQAPAPSQV
jgi:hypothetical protein